MADYSGPLQDVASVIELAVAPVFLLTGLGTTLSVLSARLARIVDRARVLVDRLAQAGPPEDGALRSELRLLDLRRRRINMAITSGVSSALFVCVLIASAFIGAMVGVDTSLAVATLFVLAMFAFIAALLLFLSEIILAVRSTRMDVL